MRRPTCRQSPELLERHGARVLVPAEGISVEGWPSAQSSRFLPTVYRASILLMPIDAWDDPDTRAGIEDVLSDMDLQAFPPSRELRPAGAPIPLALGLARGAPARIVDAWEVLQQMRAATAAEGAKLKPAMVRRFSLDHLMFTSPGLTGVPWDVTGLGGRVSGGGAGGRSRVPVSLAVSPPTRPRLPRRPTVLVPDSGTGPIPGSTSTTRLKALRPTMNSSSWRRTSRRRFSRMKGIWP